MSWKDMTMPPSQIEFPAMLWPAPWMAVRSSWRAAKRTASTASWALAQATISPGRLSIIAFQMVRASS
jgi:hypothetical protein